ncbi:hypothetical protein MKQ70_22235 [Chitinophaga sedimenti]|uniref:hypothetical protein n=1 Tax=Chitinophaga sedimenti TaxID=2033606 RepID=UPI00200579CB|nr:hypothetical protein [Chitinophaga sedimenti]MCK7557573.1 hypothetical protein [Chitinophaga sedimenti]
MYSTSTLLQGMDGTAFEKFCDPVLRKLVPELANYIPTGINDGGKTIKSLVDGFCFVGKNHMATVHITTTGIKDLATKWLYDGDAPSMTKGDLIKGIGQAKEIHKASPDFKFSIYLVHNCRVDDRLHLKVKQYNTESFINVIILEQRDFVPFLDHDPEGQYLRQKFLGINADRLSSSLLKDILLINIERYGRENYLSEASLANVPRQERVKEQLTASAKTINLLTGESGFGKSAFCYMILRSVLREGRVAYRVDPSIIEKAVSLEDAISQQILVDRATTYLHENDIRTLFKNSLIVVDDINKYPSCVAILDKLISWNNRRVEGNIVILCPVWPRNLESIQNKEKKKDYYSVISLERFSFNDCKLIIEQRTNKDIPVITEQEKHSLIFGTGFDPLLLDLSLQLMISTKGFSERLSEKAIENYYTDIVHRIHDLHQIPVYLINRALASFGREMLRQRKLNPHLDDMESWLGSESKEYKILLQIAEQHKLFSFDETGSCFFRHERIRDFLLAKAAEVLFGNVVDNQDVLGEPFFAEIIGAAIANLNIPKETIVWLINANPLSIFISLKYLSDDTSKFQREITLEVIEEWSASISQNFIPKSVTDSISNSLMGFDVKEIARVTNGFPRSPELHLARFRNGEWVQGLHFFFQVLDIFIQKSLRIGGTQYLHMLRQNT